MKFLATFLIALQASSHIYHHLVCFSASCKKPSHESISTSSRYSWQDIESWIMGYGYYSYVKKCSAIYIFILKPSLFMLKSHSYMFSWILLIHIIQVLQFLLRAGSIHVVTPWFDPGYWLGDSKAFQWQVLHHLARHETQMRSLQVLHTMEESSLLTKVLPLQNIRLRM